MDVSVIIVNYNTRKMTQECVDSVFEKTKGLDFEVILVDNGSTDDSKEIFEKDKRIKYIYSDINLGFGRANNLGFEIAKGEFIFLLNSDTYLLNNAIRSLWSAHKAENERTENVACAGCMLKNAEGSIIHSYAKFPSKWRNLMSVTFYVVLWRLHIIKEIPLSSNYNYEQFSKKHVFDVDYITGADLMVCRSAAEKYGLFDPDFFMYCEETEMQHRYMKEGLRRIIVEGPEIVHLEGKSNKRHTPARSTMLLRSLFLYFKKTESKITFFFYNRLYKLLYVTTNILCFPFVHGRPIDKWRHLADVIKL